jgi:hypothetical protein
MFPLSDETATFLKRLYYASNETATVKCLDRNNLDEVDEYDVSDDVDDLTDVFEVLDRRLTRSLCNRSEPASNASQKRNRGSVHAAVLDNESHDVYMAKTLSSANKIKIVWDLHEDNQVVQVDEYDTWESLLGWKKLKEIPHGSKQIREQYGDQLSPDVLEDVAGTNQSNSDTTPTTTQRSRGPAKTRSLNLGVSRSNRDRLRIDADEIAETFADNDSIDISYGVDADMLVLFPPSTDRLLSEHWWVAGKRNASGDYVAVANCIQGTFDYLSDYEQVLSIDEYIDYSSSHSFTTPYQTTTLDGVDKSNLVLHLAGEEMEQVMADRSLTPQMPIALNNCAMIDSTEIPDADSMVYATVSYEDMFWLRPALRAAVSKGAAPTVVTHGRGVRDLDGIGVKTASNSRLYARARLHNWQDETQLWRFIDQAAGRSLSFDARSRQLIETLGLTHDRGESPPDIQNL